MYARIDARVDDPVILNALSQQVSALLQTADQRAAAVVESMCDWTANFGGARNTATHEQWHSGFFCPYAAMAAVLRGEQDPRRGHHLDHLEWWGEGGEWIAARGHLDLEQFAAHADEIARRDGSLDDDEVPSALGYTPRHTHTRQRVVGDDESFEFCGPDADGACAYTVVDALGRRAGHGLEDHPRPVPRDQAVDVVAPRRLLHTAGPT